MELKDLTPEQLVELTNRTSDKDVLRNVATHVGVTFSGNTGVAKLKEKLLEAIEIPDEDEDEDPLPDEMPKDPISQALANQIKAEQHSDEDVHVAQEKMTYSHAELMEMDPAQVKDPKLRRQAVRAQALRLRRVRITNLDPDDAAVPGAIITVYSRYTGKVSKLIPFDEEVYKNGYHIPQILLDDLSTRTYNVRKEVSRRGSNFGVKEYKNTTAKKFMIEYLPDLTEAQIAKLAQDQAARGAIDRQA